MPYGYISDIENGVPVTHEDFVLRAAQALGVFPYAPDDTGKPFPKEFVVDPNLYKQLDEAERAVAEIKSWSGREAARQAKDQFKTELAKHITARAVAQAKLDRYQAEFDRLSEWHPTDVRFDEFRRKVLRDLDERMEQIRSFLDWLPQPKLLAGKDFKGNELENARARVHVLMIQIEQKSLEAASITSTLRRLRTSLVNDRSQSETA